MLYQNCKTEALLRETANAPLAQKMNIGVHLLDTKTRNAMTHRGEGEFDTTCGVVLIQGNLWTRTA